jgi:prepilin-type N-terminal cleavage/methylation domain-containing protein
MKFTWFKKLCHNLRRNQSGRNQSGFTLIEVMAAVMITGIIALGAAVSSSQLLLQTSRDSDITAASRNASNALYWMSRDAMMTQNITGQEGFPNTTALVLKWTSWDNVQYSANYTVQNNNLYRTYSVGSAVNTALISPNINTGAGLTSCTYSGGNITIMITSSMGEGGRVVNITKTRRIACRPDL